MKHATFGLAMAGLAATGPHLPAAAEDEKKAAMFVVIENGATATEPEAITHTLRNLFGEIVEQRNSRATRQTEINIITSANPTAVTWSGSAQDLFDQGQAVMDAITFEQTCSDVVRAWDQVDTLVMLRAPEIVDLVSVGPAIQYGFPCESATISLPQAMPQELKLGDLAHSARSLRMYDVHPDQDEALAAHFAQTGVLARGHAGELELEVRDPAGTRALYGNLLGGRR